MPNIRHSLLTRAVVVAGESNERFAALLAALRDEFKPQTFLENSLVETMAVARWRNAKTGGRSSLRQSAASRPAHSSNFRKIAKNLKITI